MFRAKLKVGFTRPTVFQGKVKPHLNHLRKLGKIKTFLYIDGVKVLIR